MSYKYMKVDELDGEAPSTTARSFVKRTNVHYFVLLFLPGHFALPAFAAEAPVACPVSIAASSINIVGTDSKWTPFVTAPVYLHGAAPLHGPPELRSEQIDFEERRRKGEVSYAYKFEGSYPQGKWLQCAYGETNQLTLSRRLPDTITACTFTYGKGGKAGQNDIRIDCR